MANFRLDRLIAENNKFFFARVVASDAGTYSIQLAPISNKLPSLLSGIPLSSVTASLLGVKECVLPQPGSLVFCFQTDAYSGLVLGVVPDAENVDKAENMASRTVIGAGDGKVSENNTQGYGTKVGLSKINFQNINRPTDIVDGEYVLGNEFGVLLGLFQQFSVLKASELAQVQAFLLDDLVRIISHNYEHHTCMGSTKVYQDGMTMNTEFGLTHDPKEATGRPNTGGQEVDPVIKLTGKTSVDDTDDFFELKNEKQVAIDRLRGFIGHLGDFLHLIISKPAEGQLRAQDGVPTEIYDRGLASVKMGLDGSMALRSMSGLAFEKTNWIRVPHRIKPVEEKVEPTETPAVPAKYTFDSTVTAGNLPFMYFLQLRDYLAFSLEGQAYERFKKSGQFEVNDEPTNEERVGEQTKLTPEREASYYPKSSGMYLMPNGGVVFRDAWGSSIVMEGGNIYIQPAKDLVLQPLRNLVGKVGQNVALAARKDLELSSTDGGFRLKTDKAQYLYSATSGIVLHSDVTAPYEYLASDNGPITEIGGIVLNTPKGGLVTNASHSLLKTAANTIIKSDLTFIDADSRVMLRSGGGFDVFTSGDLLLSAGKNLIGFTEGTALFVGLDNTAVGMQKQTIAISPFGPVEGLFEKDTFNDWKQKASELATGDFQDFSFGYREDTAFDELKFKFPSSTNYQLSERLDAIPQTLAQQEDGQFQNLGLIPWVEKEVNSTMPYPGKDLPNMLATANLANLQFDQSLGDTYNKAIEHSAVGRIDFTDLFSTYRVYA
jgi:hypothetical protein